MGGYEQAIALPLRQVGCGLAVFNRFLGNKDNRSIAFESVVRRLLAAHCRLRAGEMKRDVLLRTDDGDVHLAPLA